MSGKREPKKSETIEIRLSHEAKSAFMRRCREDDVSASAAIRSLIDASTAGPRERPTARRIQWRTIGALAAGIALGAGAAAPALAHAELTSHAAFERLDRNHDKVLSYGEFRARGARD